MPGRDFYHPIVVNALVKDHWTIVFDPLPLAYGGKDMFVDIGAERRIAIEKDNLKVALEIKGFSSDLSIHDLEVAIGQYVLYRTIIEKTQPQWNLYLAVSEITFDEVFNDKLGQLMN